MQCTSIGNSLSAFTHGFALQNAAKHVSIASYLAPRATTIARATSSPRPCSLRRAYRRRNFTTCHSLHQDGIQERLESNRLSGADESSSKVVDQIARPAPRSKRTAAQEQKEQIVSQLDPYLPLELRSKSWLENLAGFQGVRDVRSLPEVLVGGKKQLRFNLLSYIAIRQGRWDALLSLIDSLLKIKSGSTKGVEFSTNLIDHSPWSSSCLPPFLLDDLTDNSIHIHVNQDQNPRRLRPFDKFIETFMSTDDTELYQTTIGEIWECIGDILIHSAMGEIGKEDACLPFVHRILAKLHTAEAIPGATYQYDSTEIPVSRRKPPFLHAMSSRIMAAISDSVWRSVEHDTIKNAALDAVTYARKGQESPAGRAQPRVRPLDMSTWMELVLWSCFHTGHYAIATSLITRLSKVKGLHRWSLVPWQDVETSFRQKTHANHDAYEAQSWFSKLASAVEGYSQEPSLLEMPKRTISREVVLALLDAATEANDENALADANAIASAYKALSQDAAGLRSDMAYNATFARLVDANHFRGRIPEHLLALSRQTPDHARDVSPVDARTSQASASSTHHPISLQSSLAEAMEQNATRDLRAPGSEQGRRATSDSDSLIEQSTHADGSARPRTTETEAIDSLEADFVETLGNPWHGTLLSSFIHAIEDDKTKEALLQFSHLQGLIDAERQSAIRSFPLHAPADAEHANASALQTDMQIPDTTAAAFLDLVTKAKLLDFGKWLLYSQDVDGTVIPSFASRSAVFQPSLLRYAAAASDHPLLIEISQHLSVALSNFSTEILRALFECQIKLDKFDSAEEILSYLCSERRVAIDESDIVKVICSYLQLESKDPESPSLHSLRQLLIKILRTEFLPPRDPSRQIDYRPYRRVNQLCIVCASLPGSIAELAKPLIGNSGPLTSRIELKTDAFNMLVRQVRDTYGVFEAQRVVQTWCHHADEGLPEITLEQPQIDRDIFVRFVQDDKWAVNPNVETIRILLDDTGKQQAQAVMNKTSVDVGLPPDQSGQSKDQSEDITQPDSRSSSHLRRKSLMDWAELVYRRMGLKEAAIDAALAPRDSSALDT